MEFVVVLNEENKVGMRSVEGRFAKTEKEIKNIKQEMGKFREEIRKEFKNKLEEFKKSQKAENEKLVCTFKFLDEKLKLKEKKSDVLEKALKNIKREFLDLKNSIKKNVETELVAFKHYKFQKFKPYIM